MIGKRLVACQITAKLGEGGMGEVYRATDTGLERDAAIVALQRELTAGGGHREIRARTAALGPLEKPSIAPAPGSRRLATLVALLEINKEASRINVDNV